MLPRFLALLPSFIVKQGLKIYGYFYDFVNNLPIAFIAFYTVKLGLHEHMGFLHKCPPFIEKLVKIS